jgi:hypothetical protein
LLFLDYKKRINFPVSRFFSRQLGHKSQFSSKFFYEKSMDSKNR